ncbi:7160_t:CDS:2 [Funneliformis mosseae]|uniref:7160_t:CDS:1 n=1 Tax=Funneliformis mosseae TaxID=27381 RepID=A0A9N9HXA4_FUNMO|nr:7160_t:CDS:2 [Funneliformis mosseae]
MNNFEKGKELEDKTADRLDAVGVKNNKNGNRKLFVATVSIVNVLPYFRSTSVERLFKRISMHVHFVVSVANDSERSS